MTTHTKIREALDGLVSDTPEPTDIAGRALRGAARRRRVTLATGSAAAVLAVVLASVAAVQFHGGAPTDRNSATSDPAAATGALAGAAGTSSGTAPCVVAKTADNGFYNYVPGEWPSFVTVAVAALPGREDYVMQSGYAWCTFPERSTLDNGVHVAGDVNLRSNAYAVVNLGSRREAGSLTIDILLAGYGPDTCAEAAALGYFQALLSCTEASTGSPMIAVYGGEDVTTAVAFYPGGPSIAIAAIAAPSITATDLIAAVTDPKLYAVIPHAGTPAMPGTWLTGR